MYDDCFGRHNNRCVILTEMMCKNGKCPFYKSQKQYDEEKEKYPHRDKVYVK